MWPVVLFDLDGTLTDPGEGITKSVEYALRAFSIAVDDRRALRKFIGPPLQASFIEYYGFTPGDAEKAVWKYREYYAERGIFENAVFDGIPELLGGLKEAGAISMVATSKPTVYAKQILEHFGLMEFFAFVGGSELDGTRVEKGEVIRHVLESTGVDSSRAVMVGDRKHDIIGAGENGLASIGVLYGYGDRAELEEAGAGSIAGDVDSLAKMLL